jgi:hypothetical protein
MTQEVTMERFIHRENIAHYQRLLAEPRVSNDPVRHAELLRLLAEEVAKGQEAARLVACLPAH